MKEKLLEFLSTIHPIRQARQISKHPEFIEYLNILYPGVALNIQIYSLTTNTSPFCPVCGNPVKFRGKETCSMKCRVIFNKHRQPELLAKRTATLIERYGVANIQSLPEIQQKRLNTMVAKHGALVSEKTRIAARDRSDQLNVKGRITIKEKYNIDNPGQMPDHKEKCIATIFKKYGVEKYTDSEEFKVIQQARIEQKWKNIMPETIDFLAIFDPNDFKQAIFDGPNKVIQFKCKSCESIEELPTETTKWRIRNLGTCCSKCCNLIKGSKPEREIRKFVNDVLMITTINNTFMLNGKEIDIFIPEFNIGIEHDGLYYHNDLRNDREYHLEKTLVAKEKGIDLIHIFEDEWLHKCDIVKSMLRLLCGKENTIVDGSDCELKFVDSVVATNFLEMNDIQGPDGATLNIGVFHHGQLLSLMSFNQIENSIWAVSRYCSILNTKVENSAALLFDLFVRYISPLKVMTTIDRRWGGSNVYESLGFEYSCDTEIQSWFVDVARVVRCRTPFTECDTHLRIWDCGYLNYIWHRP